MEEIRNLMQEMQTIRDRIRGLLIAEQEKAEGIPDFDLSEDEGVLAIANNIDLLDAAMRSAKGVSYALQDYLSQFDEETPVILNNDNGYTYGSITYDSFMDGNFDEDGNPVDEEEE